MKWFVALLVVAVTTGCVQQPTTPNFLEAPKGESTDPRGRAQIHTELGAQYFGVGQYGIALEEANEALRSDPNYGPAYNVLGLVYAELREDATARRNFERALQINALDPDANNNYGRFLCQRKNEEDGIKYFMAALKNPLYRTPENSYVNAGVCARQRGDIGGAVEFFTRALKAKPDHVQALYQMAELAFRRADFVESKGFLDRLARINVDATAELLWLALRVERGLGDREAEATYGLQLRRNFPDSKEARSLLNRQYE